MVNWFLSADPMPGGRPGYRHELWFADVRTVWRPRCALIVPRDARRPRGACIGNWNSHFVSLEVAVRCLTKPYLIFA